MPQNLNGILKNYVFANGQYRASNNRAYYAIFRAISACLALEFKAYKQHAQVLGNFNKDFVHTGTFPKEISRRISRAQEMRHASDYDDFYVVSVEDAMEQMKTAEGYLPKMQKTF